MSNSAFQSSASQRERSQCARLSVVVKSVKLIFCTSVIFKTLVIMK